MHPNGRTLRSLCLLLLAGRVEQEATEATETKFRVSQVFPVSRVSNVFRVFSVLAPPAPLRGQTREWPPGSRIIRTSRAQLFRCSGSIFRGFRGGHITFLGIAFFETIPLIHGFNIVRGGRPRLHGMPFVRKCRPHDLQETCAV